MAVSFLHTADWQLGMTRRFLDADAQARFTQARFDAVRNIAALAAEHAAEFVVVCGDVFESNRLDRRTVARAMEAMGAFDVPLFLLPGNHDPLCPGSVYTSEAFAGRTGDRIRVLADAAPVTIRQGVELVGAPWQSKRPLQDLVGAALAPLEPLPPGQLRICAAHGGVDELAPNDADPALVRVQSAQRALNDGRVHYLALGDRHSVTRVGSGNAIWYAGAPEPTDYVENRPGYVLKVTLDDNGKVTVEELKVGCWHFVSRTDVALNTTADLEDLERWLKARPDKATTVLKLAFTGALNLDGQTRLDRALERARDLYAAIEMWDRHDRLVCIPNDTELADMQLSGFARTACEQLAAEARGDGDAAQTARDALALLYRLSAGGRA